MYSYVVFNEPATTEIYPYLHTLSPPDDLPIALAAFTAANGRAVAGLGDIPFVAEHLARQHRHAAQHRPADGGPQHASAKSKCHFKPFHCRNIGRTHADPECSSRLDRKSTRLNSSH